MSFETVMRDCANHLDRQMAAGQRYEARVEDRQAEILKKWEAAPAAERAEEMCDAFYHRDYYDRLFSLAMRLYRDRHTEAVELVNDAARRVAEYQIDDEGDNE